MKKNRFKYISKSLWLVVSVGVLAIAFGCGGSGGGGGGGLPAGYVAANGINGGQAYDKFWHSETGWTFTAAQLAAFDARSNFFRCKQCHGWDQLGNAGAYISRGPSASRPNVSAVNLRTVVASHTAQELFDEIKKSTGRRAWDVDLTTYDPVTNNTVGDQMPDFGSFMTDAQIWDLVKALREEMFDTSLLYDSSTTGVYPTGTWTAMNIGLDGNKANGLTIYNANCVACHGSDGKLIPDVDGKTGVGQFMRAKANEGQHKIKFGQLGTGMVNLPVTSLSDMKDLYKEIVDPVTYPD